MRKFRQGDVYLIHVDEADSDLERQFKTAERHVLAEGEATGHRHVLRGATPDTRIGRYGRAGSDFQILVSGGSAVLDHQEHGPIEIPEGRYIVRIQSEYSPTEYRTQIRD